VLSPAERGGRAGGETPRPGAGARAVSIVAGVAGGTATGGGAAVRGGSLLVRCDAGGGIYCLEAGRVAAIERAERLAADPGDGGRLGWLEGASEPVPVYALAARLGLEPPPGAPNGPIVVVAGGDGARCGLAVERVARATADAAPLALPDVVRAATGERFAGAVRLGERLALLLAPERLLAEGGAGGEPRREGAAAGSPEAAEAGAPGSGSAPVRTEPVPSGWPPFGSPPSARAAVRDSRPSPTHPPAARASAGPEPPPRAVMLFSAPRNGRHGATLFGLSLAQVEEVLRPVPVTPVPGAGDGLLGVLLWRDRVVPVIDLSGGPAADPAAGLPGRLLVVRGVRGPGRVAFPVRADLRVEPLPLPSRAWADGPRISSLAALGVFELAAGTVVVPDVDRILIPDRAGPDPGRAARSAPDERGESDEES
jgi:chemotaxis signal transduction protein